MAAGLGPYGTALLDNFNRANESPMVGNWTYPIFSGEDALFLVSNAVTRQPSFVGNAYWNAATFGADCEVWCTWPTVPGTDGELVTIFARLTGINASTSGYGFRLIKLGGTDTCRLRRWDPGSATTLADFSYEISSGDSMALACIGNRIEAWGMASGGSWTLIGTATDSTYSQAGYIGWEHALGAGVAIGDDFGGGTITQASARDPIRSLSWIS